MATIIAATDFSKSSLNALKYSGALAVELKAQILLVHVIELPITPLQVPLTATDLPVINMPSNELHTGKKEKEIRHEHDKISCKGCDGLCCENKKIKENRVNKTHSENN